MFICRDGQVDSIDAPSIPLGTSRNVRPLITEIELQPGLIAVIYTDGLTHAGERRGNPMDVGAVIRSVLEDQNPFPQQLADALLAHAVRLDDNRPADDISVVVIKVTPLAGDDVRRTAIRLPINTGRRP